MVLYNAKRFHVSNKNKKIIIAVSNNNMQCIFNFQTSVDIIIYIIFNGVYQNTIVSDHFHTIYIQLKLPIKGFEKTRIALKKKNYLF